METKLDSLIDPKDLTSWLQRMSSAPNQVGGPHDRQNAEWQLALFKSWGWDAHLETFEALYPTPVAVSLELLGDKPFKARLHEPPIASDRTSNVPGQLPPYVAYQGDGDVTAPLVYVNYGMPDDYEALERLGVSVRGKIVIARYGAGFRGVKPKLAQQHGAVGCLIYSDPADDGFAVDDVYPKGPERNADGVQRGSVADITLYPGDPLTPGVGSTKGVKRQLTRETAPSIMKIPTLPISYGDAEPLLEALGGPLAPRAARGALAITYHVGPSAANVHLMVKSDWSSRPIYDVVAIMKGAQAPDQWIIRGNHHDGWVFGAGDPLSGQVALMAEAKAIGALAKAGIRPKRTLVYASWDGEEPALIGSTEWAEAHAAELRRKAVVYVNSDAIVRGFLSAGGTHALTRLVNEVASDVRDPETGATLLERQRARIAVEHEQGAKAAGDADHEKRLAQLAQSGQDLPLSALGSGSDYTAFLHHLGVATLNVSFGGEGDRGGVYHSVYDSFDHYSRFGDPGETYGAVLAKVVARIVLRVANADVIPMRFGDTATTFSEYVTDLEHVIESQTQHRTRVQQLQKTDSFRLAADPLRPVAAPALAAPVEKLDFSALSTAVTRLRSAATQYDDAIASAGVSMSAKKRAGVNALLVRMEQRLLTQEGLPRRPWYRNVAYAPGVLTGYGSKTFPAVREAIEAGAYDEAQHYLGVTAAVVDGYAAALESATHLID